MKFKIMCEKGDAGFDYDTDIAEIKFDELRSDGMLPVVVKPDGRKTVLRKFDSQVDEIMWMPAIMGG